MKTIADYLEEATSLGVDVKQICYVFGINQTKLNKWINGKAKPNPMLAKQVINWLARRIKYRRKKISYMKGNTPELAAEWRFDFVVSRIGNEKVSGEEVDEVLDEIIEILERKGLFTGGGCRPILDRDYEQMEWNVQQEKKNEDI